MATKTLVIENIDPTNGADILKAYVAKLPPGMKMKSRTVYSDGNGKGHIIMEFEDTDLNKVDNFGTSEGMKEVTGYDFEDGDSKNINIKSL